jgi:hypothetical protein
MLAEIFGPKELSEIIHGQLGMLIPVGFIFSFLLFLYAKVGHINPVANGWKWVFGVALPLLWWVGLLIGLSTIWGLGDLDATVTLTIIALVLLTWAELRFIDVVFGYKIRVKLPQLKRQKSEQQENEWVSEEANGEPGTNDVFGINAATASRDQVVAALGELAEHPDRIPKIPTLAPVVEALNQITERAKKEEKAMPPSSALMDIAELGARHAIKGQEEWTRGLVPRELSEAERTSDNQFQLRREFEEQREFKMLSGKSSDGQALFKLTPHERMTYERLRAKYG